MTRKAALSRVTKLFHCVKSAAKLAWPELDIETVRIIPTEASRLVIPIMAPIELGEEWTFNRPELIGWFEKSGVKARLWRVVGKLFARDDWRKKGMFPAYRDMTLSKEEIELRRVGKFRLGYGPQTYVLAVGAFKNNGVWEPFMYD